MKNHRFFFCLFSFALLFSMLISACGTQKTSSVPTATPSLEESSDLILSDPVGSSSKMLRPIVIYATRADYTTLVPVTMDASRGRIVSYPSRIDLRRGSGFATPIPLKEGYLYDQRGITPHTAFLSISYEHYTALEEDPSPSELLSFILDKDPLVFLAVCSREYLADESLPSLLKYIDQGFPGAKILVDKRNKQN